MKSIKIDAPAGMEVESFDASADNVVIKFKKATPKDVTERIKSVEDAIEDLGEHHSEVIIYRALQSVLGSEDHPVKQQEAIIIVAALNEGWIPDWSNSSEAKYFPWFEMRGSAGFRFDLYDSWRSNSNVGSRLCLKTSALAEYAGKTFTSTYEQFMTIN